jgi:hypothetical protein
MAVDDEYAAFCLDEACLHFGDQVKAAMDAVEDKNPRMQRGKRENVLRQMLGMPRKFASPIPK